ncbi:hypothetical protein SS50377_21730 [Spironucleus salmonicida]|uniref:Uncharacterized protein n=1 Tax=Spironucleus salmonicida TaxID=348837 RepID=A0A9P8S0R4_9EUKA|nr:hypothetical protein SS50377_21730 [Spironucleus salmonicida]
MTRMCEKVLQEFLVALIRKTSSIEKVSWTTNAQQLQILSSCRLQLQILWRKLCILSTISVCRVTRTCIHQADTRTKQQSDFVTTCAITTSVQEITPGLSSVLY